MGVIIPAKRFSKENCAGLLKPIIYCYKNNELSSQAYSINTKLAEMLLKIKASRRTLQIDKYFAIILDMLPNDCVIKDFDVMFNPEYKIDVLKIMVNTCKSKPFSVIWPGRLEGNRLIYAEEGYSDYKVFDVINYDITCVK